MTEPFRARRILVPTDFSEPSRAALRVAAALASALGSRITLLHAWSTPVVAAFDFAYIPSAEDISAYTDRLEKQLAETAQALDLPADRVERRLVMGEPWREIVELAGRDACDLVVMGTHGRTGLPHLLLGSVAERVARSSKVPVMIVPSGR